MRRPSLRFGLGTLLVVISLIAVWFAITTNQARRRAAALTDLQDDGYVNFGEDVVPDWLRESIGDEYFSQEESVGLGIDADTSEKRMERLSALTKLETLSINNAAEITDESLIHLKPLKNLETVFLHSSKVRGSGLRHLSALSKLTYLCLDNSLVNDARHLGGQAGLETLSLKSTRISDETLRHLSKLANLKSLELHHTDITDDGLAKLNGLNGLQSLNVIGTNVTLEGIERLKQSLPGCSVTHTPRLGQTVSTELLFAAGSNPTPADINAKLKDLGIGGKVKTDPLRPNNPAVSLVLHSSALSDEVVLSLLESMPHIETLELNHMPVGDRLLAGLVGKPIKILGLNGTRVTDEGMKLVAQLDELRELDITITSITDDGLQHLYQAKKLENVVAIGIAGSYTENSKLMYALRKRSHEASQQSPSDASR